LGRTTNANACSCSPNLPTPKASAANYGRPRKNSRGDLQAAVLTALGLSRGLLNPRYVESMQGFPTGWVSLCASETPSCPKSPNGSDAAS
jgi:hypothetical protein